MAETQAAPSPAETQDPFNGEQPTFEEYSVYRNTGEIPARFKPAEPAETTDAATVDDQQQTDSEAQTESAGESETPTDGSQEQSRKPKNAAQRIAQLEAAIEAEWGKDEPDLVKVGQWNATIDKINGRPKRKSEAAPPQPVAAAPASQQSAQQRPPQNYQEWEQAFSPEAWIEDYAKAHPEASYEKANAAMFSYMLGAREHFQSIEQRINAERQALEGQVSEARERYEDFDEIKDAFLEKVITPQGAPNIPLPVLSLINDSPRMADVMYVIGSDERELNKFVNMAKTSPNEAIRYIARVENLIDEELSKPDNAQAASGKTPERQRTQAPAPPSPVGGSSARGFDVNDESLSTDEWMRKRNAQLAKK